MSESTSWRYRTRKRVFMRQSRAEDWLVTRPLFSRERSRARRSGLWQRFLADGLWTFLDATQRVWCFLLTHVPVPADRYPHDPADDYCAWCQKAMPGQA